MNIVKIKNYLKTKIGCSIVIIYYGSRNKKEIYRGVVYKIYDNIFAIKTSDDVIKSFSYNDILTKTVQICI